MDKSLKVEDVIIQIRDKLHKDGVKLWLEPYFHETKGVSETDMKVFVIILK